MRSLGPGGAIMTVLMSTITTGQGLRPPEARRPSHLFSDGAGPVVTGPPGCELAGVGLLERRFH